MLQDKKNSDGSYVEMIIDKYEEATVDDPLEISEIKEEIIESTTNEIKSKTRKRSKKLVVNSQRSIKLFKCEACPALFSRYSQLEFHKKIHSEENTLVRYFVLFQF